MKTRPLSKIISIVLILAMCLGVLPTSSFAVGTAELGNFKRVNVFSADTFTDIKTSDWSYENMKSVYELGLMVGQGAKHFGIDSGITVSETLTLAARLHSVYYTGKADFEKSDPWYKVYVDYIEAQAIADVSGLNMDAYATRVQFTQILANVFPDAALEATNTVSDDAIPDVKLTDSYGSSVYKLYRAGILTGNDDKGTFAPTSNIKRSEVVAIVTRMVDVSLRQKITLGDKYTVSFDLNYDGKRLPSQAVMAGGIATAPTNPARSGYRFSGWYTAAAGGSKFDFKTELTGNITLYAHWSKYSSSTDSGGANYTVTFYMNDGASTVYTTATVAAGSNVSAPTQPEKDGYAFNGWHTDAATTTAYRFQSPVTGDLPLYAKWIDPATEYFMANSDLLKIIPAEESKEMLKETDVKSVLENKGFSGNPISYDYSIAGDPVGETEIVDGSTNVHPTYQTLYLSKAGEAWAIYVINGSVFANPVSFNLESDLGAQLLLSESETLTSYDDVTNQFFVTIPHASEAIIKTVTKIDAETLDRLTIEEICRLNGATVPASVGEHTGYSESAAVLQYSASNVLSAASTRLRYSSEDPLIVVSLGDSYASGESIEPFYGQEKQLGERVKDDNWLAHRSQKSWPSLLKVPGIHGTMADYMIPLGSTNSASCRWYFAAVSGATTWNLQNPQKKEYSRVREGLGTGAEKGEKSLPAQLDAFKGIRGDVDYVTLSIGGNDVGFADVIRTCATNCAYLYVGAAAKVEDQINDTWAAFNTTKANIKKAYHDISTSAGAQAAIIVAGYPQLLAPNGEGLEINKKEAQLVNSSVSRFNAEIEDIVNECSNAGVNIYFVDVESEFLGHAAYSNSAWINKIIFSMQAQDLKSLGLGSAYSVHPNAQGAQAYARLVNDKIEGIENSKPAHRSNIAGVITIADTDTDMTNNLPLEGALVTIEYASYMDSADTSDVNGQYQLRNVPAGTYRLTITKDGYIPVSEIMEVPEDGSEVIYNIAIEAISEGHSGIGYASGTVYDAGTGLGVPGLTLNMYIGIGVTTGDIVLTTKTTANGKYETSSGLEAGNYTVAVVDKRSGISDKERYTSTSFNIKILGKLTINYQNGYVSNGVTSDSIRIVLTWGSMPKDLDSHLVGPTAAGSSFHVYYRNKSFGSEVDLDVDDTSSYGPETITIRSLNEGIYTYAVHNYSDRSSSSSTNLSASGARVQVYRGAELVMTYNVPTSKDGTLWTVFSYDSNTGRFTTINDMSYNSTNGEAVLQSASYEALLQPDKNAA